MMPGGACALVREPRAPDEAFVRAASDAVARARRHPPVGRAWRTATNLVRRHHRRRALEQRFLRRQPPTVDVPGPAPTPTTSSTSVRVAPTHRAPADRRGAPPPRRPLPCRPDAVADVWGCGRHRSPPRSTYSCYAADLGSCCTVVDRGRPTPTCCCHRQATAIDRRSHPMSEPLPRRPPPSPRRSRSTDRTRPRRAHRRGAIRSRQPPPAPPRGLVGAAVPVVVLLVLAAAACTRSGEDGMDVRTGPASRRHPRSRSAPSGHSDRRSACHHGHARPRPGRRRPGGGPHRRASTRSKTHGGVRRRPHRGEREASPLRPPHP